MSVRDATATRSAAFRVQPRRVPSRPASGAAEGGQDALPWFVKLFVVSLVVPVILTIGPLRLSPYRLILLVLFVICVARQFGSKDDPVRLADWFVFLYCGWVLVAASAVNGLAGSLQSVVITWIEFASAYLVGRCFVRNAEQFHDILRILFLIVLALLPFAVIEALSGTRIIVEAIRPFLLTYPNALPEVRLGLVRVQGPFDHPIMFGVFCVVSFTPALLILARGRIFVFRAAGAAAVAFATFLSLSSGPLGVMAVQAFLLGWHWLLRSVRARWWLLLGIGAAAYAVLAVAANRPPLEVAVSLISLDSTSYWSRKLIFGFVYQSVWAHPWMGVAFGEWDRPASVYWSIDNLWLMQAVRFGIPGFLMFSGAFAATLMAVCRARIGDSYVADCRTGYVIMMVSLIVCTMSVAPWDAVGVLFPFLLGSGAWIAQVQRPIGSAVGSEESSHKAPTARHNRLREREDSPSANGSISRRKGG